MVSPFSPVRWELIVDNFSIDAGAFAEPRNPFIANLGVAQLLMSSRLQGKNPGSVYLVPDIPEELLYTASQQFLTLEPGEKLLAIVGISSKTQKFADCALTTHGVHFRHKPIKGSADGFNPIRCPGFIAYADLPPDLKRGGLLLAKIKVGSAGKIVFASGKPSAAFLVSFLTQARAIARGEVGAPAIEPNSQAAFDRWIFDVVDVSNRLRPQLIEMRGFAGRMAMTRISVVVPAIVLACVAVFGWMCATGISPITPTIDGLIASGASFGPTIFGEHEYWRVLTAMFVHVGIIHLLMNMLVLASAGPMVEKLFGHLGFAFLYLVSGLAGTLASLAYHPMLVSAGASGAIFGIFGALIAMLLVRRDEVPMPILRQKLKSLGTFIGLNLFLGFAIPNIDMAAHAGGFVAGFVVGGALAAASKASGGMRLIARLATALAFPALLVAGGMAVNQRVMAQLETMPEFRSIKAEPAWNAFIKAAKPSLGEFDNIQNSIAQSLADEEIMPDEVPALQQLLPRIDAIKAEFADLPMADQNLAPLRDHLVKAAELRRDSVLRLLAFLDNEKRDELDGPAGFQALMRKADEEVKSFLASKDAYFKANGLKVAPVAGN